MYRLNSALEEMLTTSMGICQTRKELFGQLFEELIRQEMIACKVNCRFCRNKCISRPHAKNQYLKYIQEKGMLLLRIRTELKQTLMSYQELFEKSIVWGRQKMVESEMGWERLVARREELQAEVRDMEKVKRVWVTEVNMVTKHMEDLHDEQLKMQIEV